ncbi:50S ribosomal protein L28 [Candidatus Gracilibacteria bacterium GN02-872]|nr:50S ribosomal protein L28 [Candidatus Gracilibacteria bacterium GN02-872]RKW24520.1 MAG: 50S ribosomal protein L28 [Candidatus Gracilibacteria bacterium]
MSRICEITGKRTGIGNKRSHSMRATKRKFYPNLFYKNVKDPVTGIVYRIKVSAKGLKTLRKKGII